jgi:hypothetical protein
VDLIATLQVLLRRWYVVVPALVLTAIAVGLVYVSVQPTYQASGSVILRGPEQNQDETTGKRNQYADYGNLTIPARVVSDALSQATYQERLEQAGMPGTYTVGMDAGSMAPILTVVGVADTPADAIMTAQTVMTAADRELLRRQQNLGAPTQTFLTTEVVAAPTEAEALNGSRLRAAAGVLVIGMIITLALAFITETTARRRAARSRAAGGEPAPTAVADAFECGLCGKVLPANQIVDHLTDTHSLSGHGHHSFESLFGQDPDISDLDDGPSGGVTRKLRSAGG